MKKIVLSLFVLALTMPLAAQYVLEGYGQQLQNSDFIGWRTVSSKDMPNNWSSFSEASGNLASTAASSMQISKGTDRKGVAGNSSVKIGDNYVLITTANGNLTNGRINAGNMTASDPSNHNYTDRTDSKYYQAITVRPDSFTVWVQYKNNNDSHQARVSAILHGDANVKDPYKDHSDTRGYIVATAEQNYNKTNEQWVRLSIPFSDDGTDGKGKFTHSDPRYMLVTFTTNKTPGTGATGMLAGNKRSEVLVDDVLLIYTPKLVAKSVNTSNVVVTPGQGANVTVIYNLSGTMEPLNGDPSKNRVRIQMSDIGGVFPADSTKNIIGEVEDRGSGVTDSPADLTVTGTIPAGTPTGNYKVRLVTTNYPMVDKVNVQNVAVELKYDLALNKNIDAAGTVSGSGVFASGASAAITATPNPGYEFVNWTKGGAEVSTNASYSYTMPAENVTLIANFKPIKYALTLNVNNANYGNISGCVSGDYDYNSVQTLSANPTNADYEFVNWTGYGEPNTGNPLLFTIPLNGAALTANFRIHADIVNGLSTLLSTCNTLYSGAVEGSANGQYDTGSKAIFKAVIDEAQKVFDTRDAKLATDLKGATSELNKALRLFRLSQVDYTDGSEAPKVSFNVADNQVSVNQVIKAVSTLPLVRVPVLDEITDANANALFMFKEGSSSGLDVAFTVIVDGDKKGFNLTPTATLKTGTRYYVTLKNRTTATVDGVRTEPVPAKTFVTAADVAALNSKIAEAEVKIQDPTPEGQEIGNRVEGSTAKLQTAIDHAKNTANDPAVLQTTVDRELAALTSALSLFDDSIIAYDRVGLGVFITVAERVYDEAEEGDKNGDHIFGSKATFLSVINKAKHVWTHTGSTDDELRAAVEMLLAAINTFGNSILAVDDSKLGTAATDAQASHDAVLEGLKNGDHKEGSKKTYQEAIDEALLSLVKNNPRVTQREVDNAVYALAQATTVFEKAIVVVDYTQLAVAVTATQSLHDAAVPGNRNGDYPAIAIEELQSKIDAAIVVRDNIEATQAEVDDAIDDLAKALINFRDAVIVVDYSVLIGHIQAYSLTLGSITEGDRAGDYAAGTKAAIQLVINAGKLVRDDAKATQAEVNAAAEAFDALEDVLADNLVTVDADVLTAAIVAAEANLADKVAGFSNGNQKAGSIETYESAIARAKEARDNAKATQVSLDNAVAWLAVATANFDIAIVVVDYSLLNAAILSAEALVASDNYEDRYSEASREAFEIALGDATDLADVEDDTQVEVDAALSALRAAQSELVVNPLPVSTEHAGLGILTAYPNPADDFITINGAADATVSIYNDGGVLIMVLEAYSGQSIDVSRLASGHYIIKVNNQTVAFIKK